MKRDAGGDDPFGFELLTLSTAHLRGKVAAHPDSETRYNVLLAARAAEIAWRDRSLFAAREEAGRGLERAANASDASSAIRAGQCDADANLHGALLAMTAIATYSTRPDVLNEKERKVVEELAQ